MKKIKQANFKSDSHYYYGHQYFAGTSKKHFDAYNNSEIQNQSILKGQDNTVKNIASMNRRLEVYDINGTQTNSLRSDSIKRKQLAARLIKRAREDNKINIEQPENSFPPRRNSEKNNISILPLMNLKNNEMKINQKQSQKQNIVYQHVRSQSIEQPRTHKNHSITIANQRYEPPQKNKIINLQSIDHYVPRRNSSQYKNILVPEQLSAREYSRTNKRLNPTYISYDSQAPYLYKQSYLSAMGKTTIEK